MTETGSWTWEVHGGTAAALHDRPWPDPLARTAWDLRVARPALVLGSTQTDAVIDRVAAAALGIEVTTRRSGGGVVLLDPAASVWLDVFIPRDDPLWVDDVSRSARWLGAVWQEALAGLGVVGVVHDGAMVNGAFGRLVCFAGVGPGEVVAVDAATDGSRPKLVGISQRRTRAGARLQSQAYIGTDAVLGLDTLLAAGAIAEAFAGPDAVVDAGSATGRLALTAALRGAIAPVPVAADDLRAAFAEVLATR